MRVESIPLQSGEGRRCENRRNCQSVPCHKVPKSRSWAIIAALLGALPVTGFGAEIGDIYRVEVVVFARTGAPPNGEAWPSLASRPELTQRPSGAVTLLEGAAENAPRAATDTAPVALAPTLLEDAARTLGRRRGYRVLLHTAWRQQLTPKKGAPRVWVTGPAIAPWGETTGATDENRVPFGGDFSPSPRSDVATYDPDPWQGTIPVPHHALSGTLQLYATRAGYLRLAARLLHPVELPSGDYQPPEWVAMILDETRGIAHPGEVHYLDHPAFGVLARVDPWEPPPAAEATGSPAEPAPPSPKPASQQP